MKLVSIILPIYNVEPYIEECLQSVANQTMTEGVECIVVDDCGTDQSMQIVERFVKGYDGSILFRILHHDHNRGLSAARNTGIRAARGEYIYFLDSDDRITATCMEGFIQIIMGHSNVDLIQGFLDQDTPYMNQFLLKPLPEYTENRRYIKRALLDYDELPVCAANKMIRREVITDNNLYFKEGIIHEDNHWSFFLAKYVKSLSVLKKECYLYTVNTSSITKVVNREKEIYSFQTIIRDFCANVDPYQKGAQQYCIFLLLDMVLRSKYYHSTEGKESLFHQFYSVCNPIERLFLKLWYKAPFGTWTHNQYGRLLQRLFKLY